jgi:CheY-like chemotaxis protein
LVSRASSDVGLYRLARQLTARELVIKRPRWRDAGGRVVAARSAVIFGDRGLILEPVLLLVHDSRTCDRVEAELRKRYGADYQVLTTGSVLEALDVLGHLRDDQRQVSLVLADQWLPKATGTELLARVRHLHPAARRVLLITWGDQASAEPMLRATVLGDIDGYVVKPGTPPDEHFHRFVTEQLDEWGRSNLPRVGGGSRRRRGVGRAVP